MTFIALSDQLGRFLKQPSAALILCGYSFNDEHINDTIVNAIKSNPTAIVIALMFGNMEDGSIERYPKGVELALKRHNISFWTNDEAIIGTNRGQWIVLDKDVDDPLIQLVEVNSSTNNKTIKFGDFKVFSTFLTSLIGYQEEENKNDK